MFLDHFRKVRTALINVGLVGVFLPLLYYGSMARFVYRVYVGRAERNPPPNSAVRLADEGKGFNPANSYWVGEYDCRENDLEIRGKVPKAKYWSLLAYDDYTLPVSSYLFDETIHKDLDGTYTAYLTVKPVGRANEVNVAECPKGMFLIRTSLPQDLKDVSDHPPVLRVTARP